MDVERRLQQIKIFPVRNFYNDQELEKAVNKYVIQIFNKEGEYPFIETNSSFISVICNCLVK